MGADLASAGHIPISCLQNKRAQFELRGLGKNLAGSAHTSTRSSIFQSSINPDERQRYE